MRNGISQIISVVVYENGIRGSSTSVCSKEAFIDLSYTLHFLLYTPRKILVKPLADQEIQMYTSQLSYYLTNNRGRLSASGLIYTVRVVVVVVVVS